MQSEDQTETRIAIACLVAIPITLLMMVLAGGQMQGPDVDDGWFFWKAWNLRELGGLDDQRFRGFGVTLFGRIWIETLASAYQLTGWRLIAGRVLSTLCITGAAAIWYQLGKRLGLNRSQRIILALLLILLLPYTKAGIVARPEAFVWLLTSFAVLMLDRRRFFAAGLVAGLAIESHQMGIVSLAYLAAWSWRARTPNPAMPALDLNWKATASIAGGLSVGGAIYLALHLGPLLSASSANIAIALERQLNWHTALIEYFLNHSVLHRLWVGALIVAATSVYVAQRGWCREPFPAMIFVCVLVSYLIEPHGNPFYLIYIFLPVAFVFASLPNAIHRTLIAAAIIAVSWAGYLGNIVANRHYSAHVLSEHLDATLSHSNEPILVEPRYFPMLFRRSNLAGIGDLPEYVQGGRPFYVVAPSILRAQTRSSLPAGSTETEINLGPNATAFVFHVPVRTPPNMELPNRN